MVRLLLAIGAIVAVAGSLPAEDSWQSIYAQYRDSIVVVENGIHMTSGGVENTELVRRASRELGFELDGGFLPVSTGTGFVISSQGVLVTNAHVIAIDHVSDAKDFLFWYLGQLLDEIAG